MTVLRSALSGMMQRLHASCVAVDGTAVLLRGASGSGKSDLALRLVDAGGILVADDQVEICAVGGQLIASCPPSLAGMIEVRGIGPVNLPVEKTTTSAPVGLVVDLTKANKIERMPTTRSCFLNGVAVPVIKLYPFHASAVAKVRTALTAVPVAAETV